MAVNKILIPIPTVPAFSGSDSVKPVNAFEWPKQSDDFDEILQAKAQSRKYLIEKC